VLGVKPIDNNQVVLTVNIYLLMFQNLVPFLKTRKNQNYLSQQMKKQIDTGKKISELAKADIHTLFVKSLPAIVTI
jgi:hypothetical protein